MCWLGAGWCFASAIDAGRREIPNHSETRDVHRDAFWTQSIHTWWWKMFESVVLPVPLLVISCPAPTTSEILAHALSLFLDMLPNPCFLGIPALIHCCTQLTWYAAFRPTTRWPHHHRSGDRGQKPGPKWVQAHQTAFIHMYMYIYIHTHTYRYPKVSSCVSHCQPRMATQGPCQCLQHLRIPRAQATRWTPKVNGWKSTGKWLLNVTQWVCIYV